MEGASKGHENGGRVGAEGAASEETNAAEKGLESRRGRGTPAERMQCAMLCMLCLLRLLPLQYMMSTWLLCCGRCSARSLLQGRQAGQGSKFTRDEAARAAHTQPWCCNRAHKAAAAEHAACCSRLRAGATARAAAIPASQCKTCMHTAKWTPSKQQPSVQVNTNLLTARAPGPA